MDQVSQAGLGEADTGVSGAVVHLDGIVWFQDPSAGEDHVGDVAHSFIGFLRPKDEVWTAPHDTLGIFKIEEHDPNPVKPASGRFPNAMVQDKPALFCF